MIKKEKNIYIYINIIISAIMLSACTISLNSISQGTITENSKQSSTPSNIEVPIPNLTNSLEMDDNVWYEFTPTLNDHQRMEEIRKYIQMESECLLPCIFGVNPGRDSWLETEINFHEMGSITDSISIENEMILHGVGGLTLYPETIPIHFDLIEEDKIITKLQLKSDGFTDPITFRELWKNYSIEQIFSDYGAPDDVYINYVSSGEEENIEYYYLWIVYSRYGFYIKYFGVTESAEYLHICPRFSDSEDIQYLEIISDLSGTPMELHESISGKLLLESEGMKHIDEVMKINIDQFKEIILDKSNDGCVDISLTTW